MMSNFELPESLEVTAANCRGPVAEYAVDELSRLLGKLGCSTRVERVARPGKGFALAIGAGAPSRIAVGGVRFAGFRIRVASASVVLSAPTAKGLLNSVYKLAEELGFAFVMPGDDNEVIAPDAPRPLPVGSAVHNPRFHFCGVSSAAGVCCRSMVHTGAEWMRFYAKLRYDLVFRHAGGHIADDPRLGMRYGNGGHDFEALLPRELFAVHPEYFRLDRPDDFGGKRNPDHNLCPSSEGAWREIEKNLRSKIDEYNRYYCVQLTPGDLPGGGWCMCAKCRSYTGADQNAMVMRRLGEIFRRLGIHAELLDAAYHDTTLPSRIFPPDPQTCCWLAPRERCWGHPFDDPSCASNRHYRSAMEAQIRARPGDRDIHWGGYYFDQILFRGMHPFLPDVILGDMRYFQNRVNAFTSLQVGGRAPQPDYNMAVMGAGNWEKSLTSGEWIDRFTSKIGFAAFGAYLRERRTAFETAVRLCEFEPMDALDYRWLKEDVAPFYREMAKNFSAASKRLAQAADALENADIPPVRRPMVASELARARFEVSVLETMAMQQRGFNLRAEGRANGDSRIIEKGNSELRELLRKLPETLELGDRAGLGREAYYGDYVLHYLIPDLEARIAD